MRWLIAVALLTACEQDARQHDCKQVRGILDGTPRRYWAYSEVQKLSLHDPAVKRAADAGDMRELAALCPSAHPREHDCALIRRYVPTTEDEQKGVGIFDPSVPDASFEDPQVRAVMRDIGSAGWTAYTPYDTKSHDRNVALRQLCNIP